LEEQQRRIGIIAFIVLLCIVGLSFIYSNRFFLIYILSSFDLLNHLFLILLYSAICVPVAVLRVKFEFKAVKWIILATTALAIIYCINIAVPGTKINDNNWIFVFTQYILISSVPALYCIAFAGKEREIFVALTPFLMFIISLFISFLMINDFSETGLFILYQSIFKGVISVLWALLLIFISRMIYKFINKPKVNDAIKNNRNIKIIAFVSMALLVPLNAVLIIWSLPSEPEPIFEISFTSNEFHGEYNFEITQEGDYCLIISSRSRDVFGIVHITGNAFGEVKTIYYTTGVEINEEVQPMLFKAGIYTVIIDLTPEEWEATPARFNMTIMPLFASENKK